jgi:predicted amidohydrolase
MSPLRVALAQTSPVSADPGPPALEKAHSTSPFPTLDANLVDARDGVAAAAARGADVVVFPEYFLQGVVNDGRQYLTYASAHLQAFLAALARTHSVAVVGTIVHGNIPPAALHAPLPTGSPFEHLLTRGVGGITPAQRAWAVWLETHPQSYAEEVPVLHNTAFFIDADGELKGSYVKQNLWHPEREYLTPGTKGTHVFDTKWGKAGFQICEL